MNYTEKTKEDLIQEIIILQQSFRKVLSTSPDSVNINRLSDGMYISINPGFTKMLGYTEEEVIGKTSLELNIWADPENRKNLVKELKEKQNVENFEAIFKSLLTKILYHHL